MTKLTHRIQRNNNLNEIHFDEGFTKNGVPHGYLITRGDGLVQKEGTAHDPNGIVLQQSIRFQFGGRDLPDSLPGVTESDLLEIVRHRLQAHQKSPYATRENALALTAVEEALLWQAKRADDRAEDNKLGTDKI